jgi:hypothetical protein
MISFVFSSWIINDASSSVLNSLKYDYKRILIRMNKYIIILIRMKNYIKNTNEDEFIRYKVTPRDIICLTWFCHKVYEFVNEYFKCYTTCIDLKNIMISNYSIFEIGISYGKPVKYRNLKRGQRNSSKRHYVVTEEEIQDTCKYEIYIY